MAKHTGRRRPLSVRQKKLIKGVAAGKSIAVAGREAGYNNRQTAHEALTKLDVEMERVMERNGITIETLLKPIREGCEADKVISAVVIHKSGKKKGKDSVTNDFIEVPDHPTRIKASDLGWRLLGYLKGRDQDDKEQPIIAIQINNKIIQVNQQAITPNATDDKKATSEAKTETFHGAE